MTRTNWAEIKTNLERMCHEERELLKYEDKENSIYWTHPQLYYVKQLYYQCLEGGKLGRRGIDRPRGKFLEVKRMECGNYFKQKRNVSLLAKTGENSIDKPLEHE